LEWTKTKRRKVKRKTKKLSREDVILSPKYMAVHIIGPYIYFIGIEHHLSIYRIVPHSEWPTRNLVGVKVTRRV
jgi:hypothetical protein